MAELILVGVVLVVGPVVLGVALFLSGAITNYTPLFSLLDNLRIGRGKILKGFSPAFHRNHRYGYTMKELEETDLTDKVILITGGNAGLGFSTAKLLARQNAKVVIACRNEKKCDEAVARILEDTGIEITGMVLDLSSFQSILAFASEFKLWFEKLDALILNAGIGMVPFGLTEDGLESKIGVNHFGHFLLTRELLPLIQDAAEAEGVANIVVVASMAHFDSYPGGILPSIEAMNNRKKHHKRLAYGQSKLANVLFAQQLAERLKDQDILVNSLHPGVVKTQMFEQFMNDFVRVFGENWLTRLVEKRLGEFSWSSDEAALTQIYLAVGEKLRFKKITGKYFHPIARETKVDRHARDKELQMRLWDLTEDFVIEKTSEIRLQARRNGSFSSIF